MNRKWAMIFALVVSVGAEQTASAQMFMRPLPPGIQPFGFYTRSFGYFAPSPTGGYGFRAVQFFPRNAVGIPLAYPSISPALVYGSAGGLGRPMVDAQTLALRRAQRANGNEIEVRQQAFDKWAAEEAKPADAANQPKLPAEFRNLAAAPTDAQLQTGQALNAVLDAIHGLEKKGLKAKGVFLPPELVAHIHFDGGTPADAVNLFQDDKLHLPVTLRTPEFDSFRVALEKDFATLHEQFRAGKRLDKSVLERMAATAKKCNTMHPATADNECGWPYLNRLVDALGYLEKPEAQGLLVPSWHTSGVGVGELTAHMSKYFLTFAPTDANDDGSYATLHRALFTYFNELAAAKR
jgi:hypothetical protein